MFPQLQALTLREFTERVLEVDNSTLIMIVLLTALVIYNVRNYVANPAMCTFISPMMVGLSVVMYQVLILTEHIIPNSFNSWLVGTVLATTSGASIGIFVISVLGRLSERYAQARRRRLMPEFQDPGPAV